MSRLLNVHCDLTRVVNRFANATDEYLRRVCPEYTTDVQLWMPQVIFDRLYLHPELKAVCNATSRQLWKYVEESISDVAARVLVQYGRSPRFCVDIINKSALDQIVKLVSRQRIEPANLFIVRPIQLFENYSHVDKLFKEYSAYINNLVTDLNNGTVFD